MSKVHEDNAGYVGVSYEETQDPFYSYNKLALPLNESDKTVIRNEETFIVTVASTSGGNKYFINGTQQATVSLLEGGVYTFDQSDSSNNHHPLRFSYTENGTHNGGQEYTLGVTTNGTPGSAGAYTKIVVPFGLHDLYYYCSNHSGMGGAANVVKNTKAFTVGRPILKTTDAFGQTLSSGNNEDPFAANLVLAIPMNGANGGTTFTDVSSVIRGSGAAKTVTRINAVTKTDKSYFYGSSGYYDANSSRLQVTNSSDFDFGSGDYTIEVWVYPTDTGTRNIVSRSYTGGTGNYSGFILSTAGFLETVSQTAWNVNIAHQLPLNAWSHCAVVRNGNTWTYFVNGVSVGSATASGSVPTGPGDLYVSYRDGQTDFRGYMQDLRIYKGAAKYTTPFPTGSYGMDVVTYTGNGSTQSISGLSFQPDLVWIKATSAAYNHYLVDQVRGFNGSNAKVLQSNLTNAEESQNGPGNAFVSFDNDGFTVALGTNNWNGTNQNNQTYCAWAWAAGSSNTTISAGSLNSSAYNQSAVWSSMCSPTPSLNTFASGFDGSTATTFRGGISAGSYFTFTPTGGITFTDKIRVYNGNVSGASYKYNNGSATSFPINSWTTVATGGGTMTSFAVTRNTTAVHSENETQRKRSFGLPCTALL